MKGDFSRKTFEKEKHYRKVNMQQGRVHLDSDWNEQIDIDVHFSTSSLRDVIGQSGAPMGNAGFQIIPCGDEYLIGAGNYYVDGVMCENERTVKASEQSDLPPDTRDGSSPALPKDEGKHIIYLDVWERDISYLEEPYILEPTLGGVDTTTRTKLVWQVKTLLVGSLDSDVNCLFHLPLLKLSTGRMRARFNKCERGYQGLENHLYRVEIHGSGEAGTGSPTFKWSRDNGSVAARIREISDDLVVVHVGGKGFEAGQWVEITDDRHELLSLPGTFVKLEAVEGNQLRFYLSSVKGERVDEQNFPRGSNPKVRRWDSQGGFIDVEFDKPMPLEHGIEVEFEKGTYRTGDYWLIPARVGEPGLLWPQRAGEPEFHSPEGVEHHYSPLALLRYYEGGIELISDCRKFFPAITDLTALQYVSGDGQETSPGSVLPYPLMAGVSSGRNVVEGARVLFTIVDGRGSLLDTGGGDFKKLILETDGAGLVRCLWRLDKETQNQRVMATLMDPSGSGVGLPLYYNAKIAPYRRWRRGDRFSLGADDDELRKGMLRKLVESMMEESPEETKKLLKEFETLHALASRR